MSKNTGKQQKPLSLRARNSGSTFTQSALAVVLGVVGSGVGVAQAQQDDESELPASNAIDLIEVYGQRLAPYKAVRSGDERRSAGLADTPQTLTILTQTQIEDSGKTDLKEILAAQSGITLGTGENGNAFGDRYIIRGHEARSDVFVDGIRDPGMTTRESFATEQIEITKGPSATFAGRGSSGGAVNGISKQANAEQDFALLKGGFGSDGYQRVTFDSNQVINDQVAVRANFLYADEEIPDRAPASRERIGGLLAAKFQLSDDFSLAADYYHLEANDVPDLGSYFDQASRTPVSDIGVYLQGNDFLETQVDAFTVKADYHVSDSLRLQNATRLGKTDNGYVVTGIRGTTRALTDLAAPGVTTATLSTHQGWQEVDYLVNQTNLFWNLHQGDIEHNLVFGVEYSDEQVANGVFNINNSGATNCVVSGRRGDSDGYCALDANGNYVANLSNLLGQTFERANQDSDFDVKTVSLYAMDNVDLNHQWSGFFGVRYDDFDYRNQVLGRGAETPTAYDYSDGLWNGHVGLVRNIGSEGNVYLTYSTATNINGGESDVGGSCGYGGLCGDPDQVISSDPERVRNIELGTKWEVFDARLLATAAIFQTTKDDVMESVGDAYSSLGTLNTGKNRVQGVEVSLTGAITDKLSAQFNAALMDSEVLEAFSQDNIGLALSNFADNHAYLQLRYDATNTVSFGGSITYKSEMYGGQPDTAAGFNSELGEYSVVVPSYQVVDLFVNYYPSDKVNLKLSLNNVTDEEYWTAAYRSGSFMYLGEAPSARATLTYTF